MFSAEVLTHPFALALYGGALIGLSASALLFFQGRIAGIAGILGGLLSTGRGDLLWRLAFVLGLVGGGAVLSLLWPASMGSTDVTRPALVVAGGVMVGFGARLGSGCTSGHGVCGISRGSLRSIVATVTFMGTGAIVVAILRHGLGG